MAKRDAERLRQRLAELETERDLLRLTLMRAVVYAVRVRTGRYTPAQEADAYGALLNTAEDALAWSGEREEKAA
jgi:hypothetical protein